MYGHNIEEGHVCPSCGKTSICLIEDGQCDNQGTCDSCIANTVRFEDQDYWYPEGEQVMTTNMWRIEEAPGYEVEQTPRAWALWGPCGCDGSNEDCPSCGGTQSKIIDSCGMTEDGGPMNLNMISDALGLKGWTPIKIQSRS